MAIPMLRPFSTSRCQHPGQKVSACSRLLMKYRHQIYIYMCVCNLVPSEITMVKRGKTSKQMDHGFQRLSEYLSLVKGMLVEVALESISPWVSWSGFFRAGRSSGANPPSQDLQYLRTSSRSCRTFNPMSPPIPSVTIIPATPCNTTFISVWRHIFCSCPICFCLMPHLCFFVSSLLLLEPPIFAKMCVSYHFLVISPSKSVYGQERKIMSSHSKTA